MGTNDAVCVELKGGLGNQLFQYAAGRALSLRLSCRLVLDITAFDAPPEHITQRSFMLDRFASGAETMPALEDLAWSDYVQPSYTFDPAFNDLGRGTRLRGYFQSELFFASARETIRRELQLAVPLSPTAQTAATQIHSVENPVSIHVRRGDFVLDPATFAYHGICGPDYYERAVRVVRALCGDNPTFFVFSDDREAAREMLRHLSPLIMCATPADRPWEDLILMSQCEHHIMANSSLSWWGSWLDPRPAKTVVAPRFWVSREASRNLNTTDLHPDGTILV
jgi:hypothetical protein